jgi:hypothetical protein
MPRQTTVRTLVALTEADLRHAGMRVPVSVVMTSSVLISTPGQVIDVEHVEVLSVWW